MFADSLSHSWLGSATAGESSMLPSRVVDATRRPSGLMAASVTVADLLIDPVRCRRLRRQHHDHVAATVQRLSDLSPKIRAGSQIRIIAKHAQCAQLSNTPPDLVQALLDRGGDLPIVMGIGEESVVLRGLAPFGSR